MAKEMKIVSYDNHYRLFEHYSKLVFRARISIVTLILVVIAFVIKMKLDQKPTSVEVGTLLLDNLVSILLILSSFLLNFIYFMEIGYTRRFYLVIIAIRGLIKSRKKTPSFFSKGKFHSEAWPMHVIYGLIIILFSVMSVVFSYKTDRTSDIFIVGLSILGLISFSLFIFGWIKFKEVEKILKV